MLMPDEYAYPTFRHMKSQNRSNIFHSTHKIVGGLINLKSTFTNAADSSCPQDSDTQLSKCTIKKFNCLIFLQITKFLPSEEFIIKIQAQGNKNNIDFEPKLTIWLNF